jgi:hypothetical protein
LRPSLRGVAMGSKRGGGKQPGAGRPRTVGGKKTIEMGLNLGDDLARQIGDAADEFEIPKVEVVRRGTRFALTHKQRNVIFGGEGGRNGKKGN